MLCARYLIASEQFERTGPVERTVKSIGYATEEEEEEEVEGVDREGSSIEEEREYRTFEETEDHAPPGYTIPEKHHMKMGPSGYLVRLH